MIEDAKKRLLTKNFRIIEPPAEHRYCTGLVRPAKGYGLSSPCGTMSVERRKILKAFGAELVLTKDKGMKGAVEG